MDATNLFKKYPDAKEFYFTSDGIAWWSNDDAARHHGIMGTPDAIVECVKRDELLSTKPSKMGLKPEVVEQKNNIEEPEQEPEETAKLPDPV